METINKITVTDKLNLCERQGLLNILRTLDEQRDELHDIAEETSDGQCLLEQARHLHDARTLIAGLLDADRRLFPDDALPEGADNVVSLADRVR